MPLFTYVASYRGTTFVDQTRSSNFKGAICGVLGGMPNGALPTVGASYRNDVLDKAMRCEWVSMPNRTNLWRATFDLSGSEFSIFAIQTAT